MRINYAKTISESEEELSQVEQPVRGQRILDRVRMLRLIKSERVKSLEGVCHLT